jgi:hypothetical protein
MRFSRVFGPLLLGITTISTFSSAQDVRSIEVNPVSMTLTVGERRTILATPRDSRGTPQITADLSWSSLNPAILQISFDPNTPNVVTVTAVSAGVAQIEARSGAIRQTMVIRVDGAAQAPTLPDSVLPADVVNATLPQVARIEPQVFGATPVCRVGGFVGGDLLLTTYSAIRGADRISVTLNSGRTVDNVMVATHDAAANLALLHVPGASAGALTPGTNPTGNTSGWALGQPSCSQSVPIPVDVTASSGGLTVSRDMSNGEIGAPIVDRSGNLIAMAIGGRDAMPISRLAAIMNRGRANAAAGTTAPPGEISDRENHRHGTIVVRSDAPGSRARVTPVEDWHWAELAAEGPFPLTLNGPVGRYRIELLSGGQVRNTETFQIVASQTNQHVINVPVVTAAPVRPPVEEQVVTSGGGGGGISPIVILLGLAAAGGGAFVLLSGGSTTPTIDPPSCATDQSLCPPTTGTITISIPIPN